MTNSEKIAVYDEWQRSDDAWQAALERAFGADVGDRRYDQDQSGHPEACRRAYARFRDASRAYHEIAFSEPRSVSINETEIRADERRKCAAELRQLNKERCGYEWLPGTVWDRIIERCTTTLERGL